MRLVPVHKAEILAALARNGTRQSKIDEVAAVMNGHTLIAQDDMLTIIVSGGKVGVARRHARDSARVARLAHGAIAAYLDGLAPKSLRDKARAVLKHFGTDSPNPDRGISIAACRMLD